jgi:hypothetical protein
MVSVADPLRQPLTENNKAIPPKVTEGRITTWTNEQGRVQGHNNNSDMPLMSE